MQKEKAPKIGASYIISVEITTEKDTRVPRNDYYKG